MSGKKVMLVLMAAVIVGAALADAGCIGAFRYVVDHAAITPTPTTGPEPTQLPTISVSTAPTSAPTMTPDHVDLIYTRPLEAGGARNNTAIHVLTGIITYNGDPAKGYSVIVDTIDGCEYGNKTNDHGEFSVYFRDDGSPTYTMKVANTQNIVLYTDKMPRPTNQTGPFNIDIDVPDSKVVSVTITPPGVLMALV